MVGEKGNEASNVTGPEGQSVKGSPYAADRRRGAFRRGGTTNRGFGGFRGGKGMKIRWILGAQQEPIFYIR